MQRYGEFNMQRVRGFIYGYGITGGVTWIPARDGSFFKLAPSAGSLVVTLSITLPTNPSPPTGMRLWVEFEQDATTGGSTVVWPGTFQFQTAGDQVPASGPGQTTIWTGIYGVGGTNCFMTKLGEW